LVLRCLSFMGLGHHRASVPFRGFCANGLIPPYRRKADSSADASYRSADLSPLKSRSRVRLFFRGNGEEKSRAFARLGFHPDSASVTLDDFFANRQAHARAGIFLPRVQPLEQHENPLEIFRIDADAVVPHVKNPSVAVPPRADVNLRRSGAAELDGVPDQVL